MFVYILSDPRSDDVRYVGKTHRPLTVRLKQHTTPSALRKDTHKTHWIKSLLEQDVRPAIELVEEVEDGKVDDAERFWIEQFRSLGFKLTNATLGGEGQSRGWQPSEETRRRMSEAHQGRQRAPFTQEHRDRIAATLRGRKASEETRKKMAAAHTVHRLIQDQNGAVYTSVSDAANKLNLNSGNICNVLAGRYRQTGGYTFSILPQ